MKATTQALLGVALLAGQSAGHAAILPPQPDKALTPNSTDAPAGCKFLLSDKGWPSDHVWRQAFPGVYKKLKGTFGPDWMFQAQSVADVQKAVNFAREKNVRLTVISTGHDFHARGTGRSGLRLDMAALREPTVFSTEWKCGTGLKPATKTGKVLEFDQIQSCRVPKLNKRNPSIAVPQRNHDWVYFEKRDGVSCDHALKLRKRQMEHGHADAGPPAEIAAYNIIKPQPGQQAYARVSGGMYNEMFYAQADKSGLMTAGAQHGGVSVTGGWMQAGGHNPFVNKVGMQVDNVVEIEVVTADGEFHKVSECNEPDLFWALRGGGGNTFGVVTGLTVKVYPTFPVAVSRFFVNSTKEGVMKASAHFLREGAKLRDQYGLQGYFYIYPGSFSSALHMPDKFATEENAKAVTAKLQGEMEKLAGAKVHIEPKYYTYKTYKDWFVGEYGDEEMEEAGTKFISWYDGSDGPVPSEAAAMDNPLLMIPYQLQFPQFPLGKKRKRQADAKVMRSQANAKHYLDSRLLSDEHVNSVPAEKLAEAIDKSMPNIPGIHIRGFLYGGGKQFEPKPDAMGLLPAWRNATYHFITNAVPGSIRRDYNIRPFDKLFPDAGAYVNEASPEEPDWKNKFWGTNYPKLETLKKKYDPKNVFWCSPCVGADMLSYDDERICKNDKYPQKGAVDQTYINAESKKGIASLPGDVGIPGPLLPLVQEYLTSKKLPEKMLKSNYFKIAMGEGGSAGGKFRDMDPYQPGSKLAQGWG